MTVKSIAIYYSLHQANKVVEETHTHTLCAQRKRQAHTYQHIGTCSSCDSGTAVSDTHLKKKQKYVGDL